MASPMSSNPDTLSSMSTVIWGTAEERGRWVTAPVEGRHSRDSLSPYPGPRFHGVAQLAEHHVGPILLLGVAAQLLLSLWGGDMGWGHIMHPPMNQLRWGPA